MNLETAYQVELPLFEGPLDLLLHLIKKSDLDIHDIPIAEISRQYLEYLEFAKELNVDLAGDFLEMAAELAYIKSQMLLPQPPLEEEGPDPRADLVAKLAQYQQYKRAAEALLGRPLLGRDVFSRTFEEAEEREETLEVDTLLLLSVFQDLLKRLPREESRGVRAESLGITERILELMERLKGEHQVLFEGLFEGDRTRGEIIVTFLAVLEMARQRLIRITQPIPRGALVVLPLFTGGEGSDWN